jgi:hypothetical protein
MTNIGGLLCRFQYGHLFKVYGLEPRLGTARRCLRDAKCCYGKSLPLGHTQVEKHRCLECLAKSAHAVATPDLKNADLLDLDCDRADLSGANRKAS